MAYIEFDKVVKEYPSGGTSIRALDEASFTADQGELTVILGQSGAGKTTALNILGGMDTATSGRVVVGERDITGLRKRDLITYRRNDVGFVFQFYNLVPNLTALENVELASQICPDHFDPAETLRKVGLGERMNNFPGQLSGGEQQRVCVARALINNPKLILADEPTGNLDEKNEKIVLDLFRQLHEQGTTVIVVTHDALVASCAQREIMLNHGVLVGEKWNDKNAHDAYVAAGGKPASTGSDAEGAQHGDSSIDFIDPTKAAKTGGDHE